MNKSVIKTLGLLTIATTLLSGCRFGNYQSPDPNAKISIQKNLYFANASQLEAGVVLTDASSNANDNAPLSAIPKNLRDIFNQAVYFVTFSDPTITPAIYN